MAVFEKQAAEWIAHSSACRWALVHFPHHEMVVDWEQIARELGVVTITEGGWTGTGGTQVALDAIIKILGPDMIRGAVEFYVLDGGPGSHVAGDVLRGLQPRSAMEHCMRLYRNEGDVQTRRWAVMLLSEIGDESALEWMDELLADPDEGVSMWASKLLETLVMGDAIEPEVAEEWVKRLAVHPNPKVRRTAALVQSLIDEEQRAPSGPKLRGLARRLMEEVPELDDPENLLDAGLVYPLFGTLALELQDWMTEGREGVVDRVFRLVNEYCALQDDRVDNLLQTGLFEVLADRVDLREPTVARLEERGRFLLAEIVEFHWGEDSVRALGLEPPGTWAKPNTKKWSRT